MSPCRASPPRSTVASFVCQLITCLYLLDSQETSRMILFQILLDLGLVTWKLKKAIKIELSLKWPDMVGQG